MEFKKDSRDGSYLLLDLNLRVWGWHTIGRKAGLDFPYLTWRLAIGKPVEDLHAPAGLRWLRMTTDVAAVLREIADHELSGRSYLRSIVGKHERPVAAVDDPLPGLAELPLFVRQAGWPGLMRQFQQAARSKDAHTASDRDTPTDHSWTASRSSGVST